MEEQSDQVVSLPTPAGAAEERMLRADLVREMVARAQRAEGAKRIARELGVDRKTVKRWLRLGAWQPRRHQRRPLPIDGFFKFIEQRGPDCRRSGLVQQNLSVTKPGRKSGAKPPIGPVSFITGCSSDLCMRL